MKKVSQFDNQLEGYFENLDAFTKRIVKDALLDAASDKDGPDCWKQDDECIEEIECHARSGFIPFDSNRGGLVYQNFTDLMAYWGGGYTCAHKKAAKEIERQIDYSLECAINGFKEEYKDEIESLNIPNDKLNYHDLYELSKETKNKRYGELAEKLSEYEHDNLSDEQSSIMHEFRFLYHGQENGTHTASVSAAINTEGPYHRSSISWAPGVFCEGSKEVEITWTTPKELKKKLTKALKECSKEVF